MIAASNRRRVAVVCAGIGRSHVRGYQAVADCFEVTLLRDLDTEQRGRGGLQKWLTNRRGGV